MPPKRIHVNLNDSILKNLDKLGGKLGLDRSNTIRYCIARTVEAEMPRPATNR